MKSEGMQSLVVTLLCFSAIPSIFYQEEQQVEPVVCQSPGMTKFDKKTISDKEAKVIAEYVLKTFK